MNDRPSVRFVLKGIMKRRQSKQQQRRVRLKESGDAASHYGIDYLYPQKYCLVCRRKLKRLGTRKCGKNVGVFRR